MRSAMNKTPYMLARQVRQWRGRPIDVRVARALLRSLRRGPGGQEAAKGSRLLKRNRRPGFQPGKCGFDPHRERE